MQSEFQKILFDYSLFELDSQSLPHRVGRKIQKSKYGLANIFYIFILGISWWFKWSENGL